MNKPDGTWYDLASPVLEPFRDQAIHLITTHSSNDRVWVLQLLQLPPGR